MYCTVLYCTVSNVRGWKGTGWGNITECWMGNVKMLIWMNFKSLNIIELIHLRYECMCMNLGHTSRRTLCFYYKDQSIYAVCRYTGSVQYDSCAIYPDWLSGRPATYQLIAAVRSGEWSWSLTARLVLRLRKHGDFFHAPYHIPSHWSQCMDKCCIFQTTVAHK